MRYDGRRTDEGCRRCWDGTFMGIAFRRGASEERTIIGGNGESREETFHECTARKEPRLDRAYYILNRCVNDAFHPMWNLLYIVKRMLRLGWPMVSWSTLFTLRAVVERSDACAWARERKQGSFSTQFCQHSKLTQCGVYKKNYAVTDRRSQSASAAVLFNVNMFTQCTPTWPPDTI